MTELKILKQQKVLEKDFKVYGTIQEPLFLAKEVAEWIDYSKTSQGYYNVSKMLMTIDEDEKSTITNGNSGGSKVFLTEQGLYEVLFQSRKPIAKLFKKEVKQILKQIRFSGGYIQSNKEEEFIENYFPSFSENTKLDMVKDLRNQNQKYKQQITTLTTRIQDLEPKAQAYIDMMTAQGYVQFIDVAGMVEIGRNTLMQFLRNHKVLTKQSSFNVPYDRFRKNGYFKVVCGKTENDKFTSVTMVSPKGLNYIYKLIHKYNAENDFDTSKLLQEVQA